MAFGPHPDSEIHDFELAIRREWRRCPEYGARLTLYQFSNDLEARRAAQDLAGATSVALAAQVPDVPGIPADAAASGAIASTAVAPHGSLIVEVDTFLSIGDLRDSARVLVNQLQRL